MTEEVTVALNNETRRPGGCPSSSSSGDVDIEKLQSSASRSSDSDGHDHVDVRYAEEQFEELKRRYSNLSRVVSGQSHRKMGETVPDEGESEDEFDLEDMLRDRHRREIEHDIKPKHLGMYNCKNCLTSGVVFENMTVSGFGGAKHWIKTFPDAFNDFFNLWATFRGIFGKRRGTEFDILKDFTGCVRPGEVPLHELSCLTIDVASLGSSRQRLHHLSTSHGESTDRVHQGGRKC